MDSDGNRRTDADRTRRSWSFFWKPLALQLVLGWPLVSVDNTTPYGIVDLEFARTATRTQEILSSWPRFLPALVVVTDYWFILAYGQLLLALIWVHVVAPNDRSPLIQDSDWRVWIGNKARQCVIYTGFFDAIENFCMLGQMLFGAGAWFSSIAFWTATIKFGLLVFPCSLLLLHWIGRFVY